MVMKKIDGMKYGADQEMALMRDLWSPEIANDPYQFVMFAFPWGQKGTPLENMPGPRTWQKEVLLTLRDHIAKNGNAFTPEMLKLAVASGRGIGKSAMVAWLITWMMTTRLGSTAVVTANTEAQLKSRTFAEIRKWVTLAINSHWWDVSATIMRPTKWYESALKEDLKIDTGYYYCQAQLWSEESPDAFAGIHNHNGMLLVFDESSGIPKSIWSVSEGFFSDPTTDRYWFCFSNPRRSSGAFYDAFHSDREFWNVRNIDSRTVEGTDNAFFEKLVKQYGEDSDEARVEVRGEFPATGAVQFIGSDVVRDAMERHVTDDYYAPVVMGVDVARFGDDRSVIYIRKGRDARSVKPEYYKGLDTMELATRVAASVNRWKPDAVFVDGGGVGGGVVDRLKQLGYRVIDVQAGSKARDKEKYKNRRAELWGRGKEWLVNGGCLLSDSELFNELTVVEYKYDPQGKLLIESKDDLKKRGYSSPDCADAFLLTFAEEVPSRDFVSSRANRRPQQAQTEYKIW
jgi:hypothetical protein